MNIIEMRNSESAKGLKDLIKEFPDNCVMAEIGCYAGESTEIFLNSGKVKKLYAIDPWKKGYDANDITSETDFDLVEKLFDERTKGKNVVKLKMTMEEAFDSLPKLDVIYIDGNHSYDFVVKDIELSLKKIKKNGIICGHDYSFNDVNSAVAKYLGKAHKTFSDNSWMVQL